jgi:hypothetical protein
MVHTLQKLKTSNLTIDLEIHQHLGSLKHVINIIMWIKDMRCYSRPTLLCSSAATTAPATMSSRLHDGTGGAWTHGAGMLGGGALTNRVAQKPLDLSAMT